MARSGNRNTRLGAIGLTMGVGLTLVVATALSVGDEGEIGDATSSPPSIGSGTEIPTTTDRTETDSPPCERFVAEDGEDDSNGSRSTPWATLEHALDAVTGSGCVISVLPGHHDGARVDRRYDGPTIIRSEVPYQAVLSSDTTVLDVQGAHNVTIEGFEITHAGPGSRGVVLNVEDANDLESTHITIRNNIIHDSYHDDLLKIRSAARFITVQGNVFFNQGPREQHIDVNGVQDIVIEDNIFSNDYEASGREDAEDTKAFIVVKDSSATGELGSRRVEIRRNIFLNWQGGRETLVQIGNDGKEYFEAIDVDIENNLILGNSASYATAAFGAAGVKDVRFINNTVVGDLPSGAYGARFDQKRDNRANEGIELRNNIFSDPTGSMGDFSNGVEHGILLDNNLYWNDGEPMDDEGPVNPEDDLNGVIADPGLERSHAPIEAVVWDGTFFTGGATTVREVFVTLVQTYAVTAASSPALDQADPDQAPADDILGRSRGSSPDLGALEWGG